MPAQKPSDPTQRGEATRENKKSKEGREGIEGQGVAGLLRMRLHGYNGYESETDCNNTRSNPSTINGLVTDVKLNGQG